MPRLTVAHWGATKCQACSRKAQSSSQSEQCPALCTGSYTHRQHHHILIHMWSRTFGGPPPTSKSCHHIVPNNCPRVVKELQLSTVVGWPRAETAAGRRPVERSKRRSGLPYLGSSLSATPLCIWKSLVLSLFSFVLVFFLSPKKKNMFLQIWQLNFLAVC